MSIQELIRKRGSIKRQLTNFNKYVEEVRGSIATDSLTYNQLKVRLNDIKCILKEFDAINEQIICVVGDEREIECHYDERDTFANNYYTSITSASVLVENSIINNLEMSNSECSGRATPREVQSVKLPTIPVPKFTGSYDNWLEYKDLFESLIHRNESISNVQKFHYLRASLSGSAAQIIHSLEFTAPNYEIAWQLICERFNNKRLLVHNHVKAIFDCHKIMTESSKSIRQLIDEVGKHLRALEILGQPTKHWDTLIIYIVSNKLDANTMREWEQEKKGEQLSSFLDLKTFLTSKADLLETLEQKLNKTKIKNSAFVANTFKCNFCKESHLIYHCREFLKLSVIERKNKAKDLKLCLNCLRTNHTTENCTLPGCKVCKEKHNSLLHQAKRENVTATVTASPTTSSEPQVILSCNDLSKNTLLATAVVYVWNVKTELEKCRTLLDNGSQSNFITYRMCKKLGCKLEKADISISGIGKVQSKIKLRCLVTIKSQYNSFNVTISCLVISNISEGLPTEDVDISQFQIPSDVDLADALFYKQNSIDLLIGAGVFWDIIEGTKIKIPNSPFSLHASKLPWLVSEQMPSSVQPHCNLSTKNETESKLLDQLKKFWELEHYENFSKFSKDEQECENLFKESFYRNEDGRFVVKLPLKDSPKKLGNSYNIALKRFLMLERNKSY